jgi:hypothetical protein
MLPLQSHFSQSFPIDLQVLEGSQSNFLNVVQRDVRQRQMPTIGS